MTSIQELSRRAAPAVTPQALACDGEHLWLSSRDLGTFYKVDAQSFEVLDELDPPGVVWAAVRTNDGWRLTLGKGLNDDRYIYRYAPGEGFQRLFRCPESTGSYLSFDGSRLYLSQWYKGEIHQINDAGEIALTIQVGAEICGHTFANGELYVLRGKENAEQQGRPEEWRLARVRFAEGNTTIEDLAQVPFASRSLAFDGERFWSNHRAANETVSFTI